jgi:hypothetical protein
MTLHPLRVELNPATGLPRLVAPVGTLTEDEHSLLEAEVVRRHSQLLRHDEKVCKFSTQTRLAPDRCFLVRVRRGCPRLPTLMLYPCPQQAPTSVSWGDRLLADLREVVHGSVLLDESNAETCAFEEAVDGLARLAEASPDCLALVLLEGYLALHAASLPHRDLARRRLRKVWSRLKKPCKSAG